jgi:hypothetical protein
VKRGCKRAQSCRNLAHNIYSGKAPKGIITTVATGVSTVPESSTQQKENPDISKRYDVTNEEKENNSMPVRKVIHKSHIPKVMFLAATARPRFDDSGRCLFDGKIGIWPIVTRTPALRNSVNRPAGTIVTKPQNVNHQIYRQMLLEKVIPAIKNRFPHNRNRSVVIQQDGAGAHIPSNDDIFREELNRIRGKCLVDLVFFSLVVLTLQS